MSFKTPGQILSTIEYGDQVERVRSNNRRKVDDGFNGVPPLSSLDATKMGLDINVDFGEMAILGQHGRRQYYNFFLKPASFFKVKLPTAPVEKRMDWETKLTQLINKPMKKSREYYDLVRSKFAAVVAHGIGPQMWLNSEDWMPECIALEDLRVPTDTKTSLSNLTWFALRKKYTVGELVKRALGDNADEGWQKDQVLAILKEYKGDLTQVTDQTLYDSPEYWASLIKQNGGFYQSDASPSIPLWHFYYCDDNGDWFLRVVAARECRGANAEKFVFDNGDSVFADSLDKILHVQFGDLNSKSPFLWHAVRSLGFLLKEPCFWMNIFRCRLMGHCMENMNMGFRVTNPSDRGRVQKIQMMNKFVLDQSTQIIPENERHQIDGPLVETTMAQLKQLQGEAAVSFTQDLDTAGNKEMTATETMARVSQVNALMSGLLLTAATYEKYAYQEISRRFCLKDTENKDARKFQLACKRAGIPPQYMDVERWDIEVEAPLGAGNPTMEMAQAQALLGMISMLAPEKQEFVKHMYVEAVTGDANVAEFIAPAEPKPVITDAQTAAQFAFGPMMQGIPVNLPERLNPIEQIETLLGMMSGVVGQILQSGSMATEQQIIGLHTVAQYIEYLMQRLSQNDSEQDRVREYSDALSTIMNEVKGFEQRLQEEREAQAQQGDPEAIAKAESTMMLSGVKAEISQQNAAQKQEQSDAKFAQKMQQSEDKHIQNITQAVEKQMAEMRKQMAQLQADLVAQSAKTQADVLATQTKAKSQAKAKPKTPTD